MEDEPVIEQTDPRRPEARAALSQYLEEVVRRIGVADNSGMVDEVDEFVAPGGAFLLVWRDDEVVGCGGIRAMAPGVGEVKRMWIRSDCRGMGLGDRLLSALIAESRALGHETVRLDTNAALTEALAMYAKHGFEPVERFNENPDATHFLRKTL